MLSASAASAGILARTAAFWATSAWVVVAPMTMWPPSSLTPLSPEMPPRSTMSEGLARRCLRVGISVMPPLMSLPSEAPESSWTASSTETAR